MSAEVDRGISEYEQRSAALRESAKGLALVNGGGAVALGALLGQLWEKAPAIRSWVLSGILCLVAGVAFASVLSYLRYRSTFHPDRHKIGASPWWQAQKWCTVLSVAAFALGMVLAVIGGFLALCAPRRNGPRRALLARTCPR
jgi:hypothetical protein